MTNPTPRGFQEGVINQDHRLLCFAGLPEKNIILDNRRRVEKYDTYDEVLQDSNRCIIIKKWYYPCPRDLIFEMLLLPLIFTFPPCNPT